MRCQYDNSGPTIHRYHVKPIKLGKPDRSIFTGKNSLRMRGNNTKSPHALHVKSIARASTYTVLHDLTSQITRNVEPMLF